MEYLQKVWPALATAIGLLAAVMSLYGLYRSDPKRRVRWLYTVALAAVLLTCTLCFFFLTELEDMQNDKNELLDFIAGHEPENRLELVQFLKDLRRAEQKCDSLVKADSVAVAKYFEVLRELRIIEDSVAWLEQNAALVSVAISVFDDFTTELETSLAKVRTSIVWRQQQNELLSGALGRMSIRVDTLQSLKTSLIKQKPVPTPSTAFAIVLPRKEILLQPTLQQLIGSSVQVARLVPRVTVTPTLFQRFSQTKLLNGIRFSGIRWPGPSTESLLQAADSVARRLGEKVYAIRARTILTENFNNILETHTASVDSARQCCSDSVHSVREEAMESELRLSGLDSLRDSRHSEFDLLRDSLAIAAGLHEKGIDTCIEITNRINNRTNQQIVLINNVVDLYIARLHSQIDSL